MVTEAEARAGLLKSSDGDDNGLDCKEWKHVDNDDHCGDDDNNSNSDTNNHDSGHSRGRSAMVMITLTTTTTATTKPMTVRPRPMLKIQRQRLWPRLRCQHPNTMTDHKCESEGNRDRKRQRQGLSR
eukprot:scaffold220170_cov18-Prasinocladus_malaysianus.AAC.1